MPILTNITEQYHSATQGWFHYLFPIANKIFATLATIELAWSGIWWALNHNEISSVWAEFLQKILVIGFFYTLLLHAQDWLPAMIKSFMAIGAGATHQQKLYPSDIFSQGLELSEQIFSSMRLDNFAQFLVTALVSVFSALMVLIAFTLIAAQMVVAQIEAYLVVGAGVLLLGFSASRWTQFLSINYLHYAVSVGIKLFMLFMIVSVGGNIATEWHKMIASGIGQGPAPLLEVTGGALIFMYVVWIIPLKAQGLVTGNSDTGARNVLVSSGRFLRSMASVVKHFSQNKQDRQSSSMSRIQQAISTYSRNSSHVARQTMHHKTSLSNAAAQSTKKPSGAPMTKEKHSPARSQAQKQQSAPKSTSTIQNQTKTNVVPPAKKGSINNRGVHQ